jgi:hypothetical protein
MQLFKEGFTLRFCRLLEDTHAKITVQISTLFTQNRLGQIIELFSSPEVPPAQH